jgi:glycolate oxidase subunit GlcD
VTAEVQSDLRLLLPPGSVLDGTPAAYLADETEARGVNGRADAVVLPETVEEVATVVAWCYERGVAIVPRGGGTGFAAGAVPLDGGVVVSLERLTRVRSFDPLLWRIWVEAGLRTAELRRIVRQSGLFFPPDPGAAEQSQIGGNIATNAGGPHAFKYGVTGAWVTGLEAVLPPGEIVSLGGAIRKDVAGYDLKSLLIGSEGTLGIVTAAWLRLLPAPEASYPVAAFYPSAEEGCKAIEAVLGNGLVVAALEYLDGFTLRAAGPAFPAQVPSAAGFLVVAEADGSEAEATGMRAVLLDALGDQALAVHAPEETAAIEALWRWRDGVSIAVSAQLGGKVSEDIVVPLDRLAEAIDQTLAIGGRHGLSACSWGHAGDGNLHATFLVSPGSADELERARAAAEELFVLAVSLGGSVSGEHGVGVVKRGRQGWSPKTAALMTAVKDAFDPRGLMNPGKKI